jgi:hypothetical protein
VRVTHSIRFFAGIALVSLLAMSLPAQSIYGTLTGIVSDPSQAVIAKATIKLRDEQSGSLRETLTNSDGYYTFVFGSARRLRIDRHRARV